MKLIWNKGWVLQECRTLHTNRLTRRWLGLVIAMDLRRTMSGVCRSRNLHKMFLILLKGLTINCTIVRILLRAGQIDVGFFFVAFVAPKIEVKAEPQAPRGSGGTHRRERHGVFENWWTISWCFCVSQEILWQGGFPCCWSLKCLYSSASLVVIWICADSH